MRSLSKALHLGDVDEYELLALLSWDIGSGSMSERERALYLNGRYGVGPVLVVRFSAKGHISDLVAGPAMDEARLQELARRIEENLMVSQGYFVWREVFFSYVPIEGYWRRGDSWQILPVPEAAPRAPKGIYPHPFLAEIRVHNCPEQQIRLMRGDRRAWKLAALLSVLLYRGVTRSSPPSSPRWVCAQEQQRPVGEPLCLREGYAYPGFVREDTTFTATDELEAMPEMENSVYFATRGVGLDEVQSVPVCIQLVCERLESADPSDRDRFIRACHWFQQGAATWANPTSLGYLAFINALETLLPATRQGVCTACGRNRGPSIGEALRDFIETYAPSPDGRKRPNLYELRSALVHGRVLLARDEPLAMATRHVELEHWITYDQAQEISHVALINWLIVKTTPSGQVPPTI